MNTVAFTGYRPEKMPFVEDKHDEGYLRFRVQQLKVINRLVERGYTHFRCGYPTSTASLCFAKQ